MGVIDTYFPWNPSKERLHLSHLLIPSLLPAPKMLMVAKAAFEKRMQGA